MITNAIISAEYVPFAAENGKFTAIDSDYLQTLGYPATGGCGRYAIFTYQINPADLILSGGNVTVSSVQITNDVVIDKILTPIMVSALEFPVSATIINSPVISAITDPVSVSLPTSAVLVCSVNLAANTSAVFNFNPIVTLIEIYNNSNNKIYLDYTDDGIFDDIISRGMIVGGESFYRTEKTVESLTIASTGDSDVRIFAHRR